MVFLIAVLLHYYSIIRAGDVSPDTIQGYAMTEAIMAHVNPQIVMGVIKAESGYNPTKVNYNDMAKGCNSVGLVQIRDCNHPDVTFAQATNPVFAVNFLIQNIDKCHTWWKATCPAGVLRIPDPSPEQVE